MVKSYKDCVSSLIQKVANAALDQFILQRGLVESSRKLAAAINNNPNNMSPSSVHTQQKNMSSLQMPPPRPNPIRLANRRPTTPIPTSPLQFSFSSGPTLQFTAPIQQSSMEEETLGSAMNSSSQEHASSDM